MFELIVSVIEKGGYLGIALLMFVENIFPPIPSEIILPLAGFAAAKGELNVVGVILSATTGTLLGALPWYYAGRFFSLERLKRFSVRFGRLLTLTPEELDYAAAWFYRVGNKAVFLGRLMPIVRTLISVPAGLVRLPLFYFLLYTALGTLLWSSLLIGMGFMLESQYEQVASFLNPVTDLIIIFIVCTYIYRVATFGHKIK